MASLSALPEELKIHILSYLSDEPLFTRKLLLTPSASLLGSDKDCPLKSMATASHTWRRLLKPMLFRHIVMRLDRWMPYEFENTSFSDTVHGSEVLPGEENPALRTALQAGQASLLAFVHECQSFANIQGLTILISKRLGACNGQVGKSSRPTRLNVISPFWQEICNAIEPLRITVVAPVTILIGLCLQHALTNDLLDFPDMAMQAIEIHRHDPLLVAKRCIAELGRGRERKVLRERPWTHITLSEGSALKAYSGYEYFHKRMPSMLPTMCLRIRGLYITSLSLHILFPFSTLIEEVELRKLARGLMHLSFTFTPQPGDNTLDDPEKVGKADLADCWRETEQIYARSINPGNSYLFDDRSMMESFTCGDYAIESIREILNKGFEVHASKGWVMVRPGQWKLSSEGKAARAERERRIVYDDSYSS